MLSAFINCFKIKELRDRILFTLLILVIIRIGTFIPVPGVDSSVLQEYFAAKAQEQGTNVLSMFNMFSGGALGRCAIFALTIMPYISVSIIMTLAQGAIPQLAKIAREEGGRQRINQWTRFGTLLVCLVQGYFFASGWMNASAVFPGIQDYGQVVREPGWFFIFTTVITLTTGTMLLMWLGEQITERGIGNGISLIITIGILAELPNALIQTFIVFNPASQDAKSPLLVVLLVGFLFAVIAGTIMITQALRKVRVQYAKTMRGNKMYGGQSSYLPLKVNYAGVMPIILANMLLVFPATIGQFFGEGSMLGQASAFIQRPMVYYSLYALMIFFFAYFWVTLQFNPTEIADNMKRNGGFIPGVRPGEKTADFLDYSMTRLTFAGSVFLVGLALLPLMLGSALGIPGSMAQFFGGTGLLITVGVMLDTMRQMETHLLQRHYDGFLKKGRVRGRSQQYSASGESLESNRLIYLVVVVAIVAIAGASMLLYRGVYAQG